MVHPILNFKLLDVQTLGTPGAAQRVSLSEIPVEAVLIQAERTNSGDLYIGDSSVDSSKGIPLRPGARFCVDGDREHGAPCYIDLKSIYFDGATAGDKIRVLYIQIKFDSA